jgi:hypothetical protein
MVEATGLKYMASRPSLLSSPPYKMSSKSANQFKSYSGVSLHPPQKFNRPPFWNGWSYRIKISGFRSSSMESPSYKISSKSTHKFKSYWWWGDTDRLVILQDFSFFNESRLQIHVIMYVRVTYGLDKGFLCHLLFNFQINLAERNNHNSYCLRHFGGC